MRANNIKMWKDWSLSRESEDIKKKQKEILLLKKYPKQKISGLTVWKNGDNNKKKSVSLKKDQQNNIKQSGEKDWGKKGPTFLWDNNKKSVIWVFRVLKEEEGLLQKNSQILLTHWKS